LLDHLDAATQTKAEGGEDDNNYSLSINRIQLLELALAISNRAHQLGLAYHWPLYQRLAIVVAKYPNIIEEKNSGTMTTLGSLADNSRGEWIRTIHSWSKTTWGSDMGDKGNDGHPIFQTDQNDLKWFHPSLKVLAAGAQWSDVWRILIGLLRPLPETARNDDETRHHNCNKAFHSTESSRRSHRSIHHRDTIFAAAENDDDSNSNNCHNSTYSDRNFDDDDAALLSATIFSYLDEELVLDLLLPMDQQGLLDNLWNNGERYPPPKSVEETCDIIIMMEASIWKIFAGIPNPIKANISTKTMDHNEKYSLQDAIKILLKYGPAKRNKKDILDLDDDQEEGEYFLENNDKDNLAQALKDLEDLLDEHLNTEEDDESGNDRNAEQGSEAIALATVLSNQIKCDGSKDNRYNSDVDSNTPGNKSSRNFSDITKVQVRRSGSEHDMEMANLDDKSHHSTEEYLEGLEEDGYLDLIYDNRAVDYKDNIPDITNHIYKENGGKQLRYTASMEHHIYEGMQQRLDYDSEDDDDIPYF